MSCVRLEDERLACADCPERVTASVERCPARWLFQHVGDKWTLPILGALHEGPLRFSHIRKRFSSLSERMLILTLNKLESSNLVVHGSAEGLPAQKVYGLTPLGCSLLEHIGELYLWMGENAPAMLSAYSAAAPDKT